MMSINSLIEVARSSCVNDQLFRSFRMRPCSPENPFRVENWGINTYFEQYIMLQALTQEEKANTISNRD